MDSYIDRHTLTNTNAHLVEDVGKGKASLVECSPAGHDHVGAGLTLRPCQRDRLHPFGHLQWLLQLKVKKIFITFK